MTVEEIVQCIEDICVDDAFHCVLTYGIDKQKYDEEYSVHHNRLVSFVEKSYSYIKNWSKDELVIFITNSYKPTGELSSEILDFMNWIPIKGY